MNVESPVEFDASWVKNGSAVVKCIYMLCFVLSVFRSEFGFHSDSISRTFCYLHALFYLKGIVESEKTYV